MTPTLEERIMATGQTLERVREWQSIIESIAAKSGEPKEDVASIILRPLSSGKVMLEDFYKLQEIGVPLSESFMKLVPLGKATSKALLHELTRLGHNSEKKRKDYTAAVDYRRKILMGEAPDSKPQAEEMDKSEPLSEKFEAFFKKNNETSWPNDVSEVARQSVEKHQTAHFGTENQQPISNKVDIFPNAVLIDGHPVRVKEDGVFINNYADRTGVMTLSLELMPDEVRVHPHMREEEGIYNEAD